MHKKIKVVFIINNFLIGGVERLLLDILTFFDKDKFEVQIVTVFGSGPLEQDFRKLGMPIYFAGPKNMASKHLPFKLYWLIVAPITIIRIAFFLYKNKTDVVVTSLYQADILGMLAAKIIGIKKRIIIQHDVQEFGKLRNYVKKIFAFDFSTNIISISETVKNFLIEKFKVKAEKIVIISNGIDYSKFEKGVKEGNLDGLLVVGVVGRFESVKGHKYLLEALKILKEENDLLPEVLIVGDGSLRKELEDYTSENNLTNVKFLGSTNDVVGVLKHIDILVIPSIEEGFGLVVLEGMVSGKVVVASDISAFKELIKDGENGILFKKCDSANLAKLLRKIMSDRTQYNLIKENTFNFIQKGEAKYNIKEVSKNYQKFIENLI